MPLIGLATPGKSHRCFPNLTREFWLGGAFLLLADLTLTAQPGLSAERQAGIIDGTAPAASAVVMMYHRFGESGLPATNIRIAQFEAHLLRGRVTAHRSTFPTNFPQPVRRNRQAEELLLLL